MIDAEGGMTERDGDEVVKPRPVTLNVATWRYQGDRDAADRAYCTRFGVAAAPEPVIALGGAWAYPLPAPERRG